MPLITARIICTPFTLVYVKPLFIDHTDGKEVHLYKDRAGVYWMKTSRWAFFRVRVKDETIPKG